MTLHRFIFIICIFWCAFLEIIVEWFLVAFFIWKLLLLIAENKQIQLMWETTILTDELLGEKLPWYRTCALEKPWRVPDTRCGTLGQKHRDKQKYKSTNTWQCKSDKWTKQQFELSLSRNLSALQETLRVPDFIGGMQMVAPIGTVHVLRKLLCLWLYVGAEIWSSPGRNT